ncbi:hypothetical protein GQ53DRAFT_836222 [Thozetella sp. PMI_491]|nr:hypothetical protein GQ53DRAFT_836222 [Thozetella sp. PMI_491]
MHGKGAVVAVFGERLANPSECNITVGLSVFAASPHVAFLYTDVEFNKTFVLQTKGCFTALLPPGTPNPHFDYDTKWDDLPQTSYENLMRVSVPPPVKLDSSEIALDGNTKLNMDALLQDLPVSEEIMGTILDNEENLKTLALTAKTRGQQEKLHAWLDKIDRKLDEPAPQQPLAAPKPSALLAKVASDLASEHPPYIPTVTYTSYQPLDKIVLNRRLSSDHARRLSGKSITYARDSLGCVHPKGAAKTKATRPPAKVQPGFTTPSNPKHSFEGACMICDDQAVLHFLLVDPPTTEATKDLPAPGSHSKLIFPLTMGNYPETDVVSTLLSCNSCVDSFLRGFNTRNGEKAVSAVPLVSLTQSRVAWLKAVSLALKHRFDHSDLPQILLAILYTKLERLLVPHSGGYGLIFRQALEWECSMLQSEITLENCMNPPTQSLGTGVMHEAVVRSFRDSLNAKHPELPLLLQYPLDGFIVANAILSNSRHKTLLSGEKRKTVVLLRFLYHITETYCAFEAASNPASLHGAKALLLSVDNPQGPRSLFKWDSLRKLSVRNIHEVMGFLGSMITQFEFRMAISAKDLAETPFLSAESLRDFRRLGVLFSGVENQAGQAISVFVHHLLRSDVVDSTPQDRFRKLRDLPTVAQALGDPEGLSMRMVQTLIKDLPKLNGWPVAGSNTFNEPKAT